MMNEREIPLYRRMMEVTKICQRELRWNPTAAVQMVNDHGPVEAARRMVLTDGGTDGFARCWEEGRLELSVEAIVLEGEFRDRFEEDILSIARKRLDEARRNPPRRL